MILSLILQIYHSQAGVRNKHPDGELEPASVLKYQYHILAIYNK